MFRAVSPHTLACDAQELAAKLDAEKGISENALLAAAQANGVSPTSPAGSSPAAGHAEAAAEAAKEEGEEESAEEQVCRRPKLCATSRRPPCWQWHRHALHAAAIDSEGSL